MSGSRSSGDRSVRRIGRQSQHCHRSADDIGGRGLRGVDFPRSSAVASARRADLHLPERSMRGVFSKGDAGAVAAILTECFADQRLSRHGSGVTVGVHRRGARGVFAPSMLACGPCRCGARASSRSPFERRGSNGLRLGVSFLDGASRRLRAMRRLTTSTAHDCGSVVLPCGMNRAKTTCARLLVGAPLVLALAASALDRQAPACGGASTTVRMVPANCVCSSSCCRAFICGRFQTVVRIPARN